MKWQQSQNRKAQQQRSYHTTVNGSQIICISFVQIVALPTED